MAFDPFHHELAEARAVEIPPGLEEKDRSEFVRRVAAAVKQQADLAAKTPAFLRVTGAIEEIGDLLLIPHEAAHPFHYEHGLRGDERPSIDELWWLTALALRAMKPADARKIAHGGLQPGSFYCDRTGRVKIGDFGIVPVFEHICGSEKRRFVHCENEIGDVGGRKISGTWRLLEDVEREFGWMAPLFPPEILESASKLRLSPKSDQFTLGVTLYALATGAHPFGMEFSDPTLIGFFQLEPSALDDERSEWSDALKRHKKDTKTSTDAPIAAWSDLIKQLLQIDPSERYASIAEVEQEANPYVNKRWDDAFAALGTAIERLDAGDADGFLKGVSAHLSDGAVPPFWHNRLTALARDVDARKAVIAQQRAHITKLETADQAIDRGDFAAARAAANELLSADADAAIRSRAQEIVRECDEQSRILHDGAAELAASNIRSAREAIDSGDFDEARACIEAISRDPLAPAASKTEAEALLRELDEIKRRRQQEQVRLATARTAFEQGRLDEAEEHLGPLLGSDVASPAISASAHALRDEIQQVRESCAQFAEQLAQAHAAWEQAQLASLDSLLAALPANLIDRALTQRKSELSQRLERLKMQFAALDKAEATLDSGDADRARQQAQKIPIDDAPPSLRERVEAVITRCDQVIEQTRRHAIENTREALAKAGEALHAGDIGTAEMLVRSVNEVAADLPTEVQHEAATLSERCKRVRRTVDALFGAKEKLRADDPDGAEASLASIDQSDAPRVLIEEIQSLRSEVSAARAAAVERARQALERKLENAAELLPKGLLDDAEKILNEVDASPYVTTSLRAIAADVRAEMLRQQPLLETLAAAEQALERDKIAASLQLLDNGGEFGGKRYAALPEKLPNWARQRAEELRKRINHVKERARRQAIQTATEALDAAERALERGEYESAREPLETARVGLSFDESLGKRHAALSRAAAVLEEWMPRVVAAETLLERDLLAAEREAAAILAEEKIPKIAKARLDKVRKSAGERIKTRRSELTTSVSQLAQELQQRGRKARDFLSRVDAVAADPIADEKIRQDAQSLRSQFDTLPVARKSIVPIAAAGGVVLIAVVAGVLIFSRKPAPPPGPTPPPVVVDPLPPSLVNTGENENANANADEPPSIDPSLQNQNANDNVEPAPPPEPDVPTLAERLAAHKPDIRAPADLAALIGSEQKDIEDALLRSLRLINETAPALEMDPPAPDRWRPRADEPMTATQDVSVRCNGLNLSVTVTIRGLDSAPWWDVAWTVDAASSGAVRDWLAARCRQKIQDTADSGNLAAAWDLFDDLAEALGAFATIGDIDAPPRWREREGLVAAGELDERTGYPVRVRDTLRNRPMLLVAFPPNDPVWPLFESRAVAAWRIYYIDLDEYDEAIDDFTTAQQKAAPRRLPTRLEWQLAAIRVRRQADEMVDAGGSYEWCAPDGDEAPWVSGGCTNVTLPNSVPVVRPPAGDDPAELLAWMQHPLVEQQREFGDGLVTIRPIVPLYPPE